MTKKSDFQHLCEKLEYMHFLGNVNRLWSYRVPKYGRQRKHLYKLLWKQLRMHTIMCNRRMALAFYIFHKRKIVDYLAVHWRAGTDSFAEQPSFSRFVLSE